MQKSQSSRDPQRPMGSCSYGVPCQQCGTRKQKAMHHVAVHSDNHVAGRDACIRCALSNACLHTDSAVCKLMRKLQAAACRAAAHTQAWHGGAHIGARAHTPCGDWIDLRTWVRSVPACSPALPAALHNMHLTVLLVTASRDPPGTARQPGQTPLAARRPAAPQRARTATPQPGQCIVMHAVTQLPGMAACARRAMRCGRCISAALLAGPWGAPGQSQAARDAPGARP